MSDFRAFCPSTEPMPRELRLSAEESHHLVVVNRARRGDTVIAFDGQGTEWTCELQADSKREAVLAVRSTQRAAPLPFDITLAQALPKGPSMDAIVRKATEIGARRIVPIESARTQVHLDRDRSDKKAGKWQVAALEAAKQCGNPWLPEIAPVQSLETFLKKLPGQKEPLKLIASLHAGAKSLKTVLADFQKANGHAPTAAVWLIGPEGDFTPEEMSAALAAGFAPVTLGPLVLRCETAAVYALSVLSHELGA
ncbi:MAG TPA: 16S rRNA (uracil(1498)-N(3))-methyltransferase [Rariglobus sp.]|jgi:16S rRNA (uracil1498-N3)-methyltransferase|nr:16S rRNA (uracil(1498)-N(3))-methyltransferase [Rariglobus sp.]